MIQLGGFARAKEIARLPFGRDARHHFTYHIDVPRRWEDALDARAALDLIGGASIAAGNLPDVRAWLGELTDEEQQFRRRYTELVRRTAALTTTLPMPVDAEPDIYESLLDARVLQPLVPSPRRVLDIGPGAGRQLLNLALRPWGQGSSYAGVESVGLPYLLQNMIGSTLGMTEPAWQFADQIDYDLARAELDPATMLAPRRAWHLPLWRVDRLPSQAFDLIVCNYVLDELSAADFRRVVDLVARCLAPDGVLYCRGGQQRAQFTPLYLFGFGTFHQQDITAALLQRGLRITRAELIASTLTRTFVRDDSAAAGDAGGYTAIRSDHELVDRVQRDYVATVVSALAARQARVLIWADPGFDGTTALLGPHVSRLNAVAVTNEHIMQEGVGAFGIRSVPLSMITSLGVDAVLIAGYRTQLAVRELRAALGDTQLGAVRQFNLPFAHAPIGTGAGA